jgi:hypothetical protein
LNTDSTANIDQTLKIFELSFSHRVSRKGFIEATDIEDAKTKLIERVSDVNDLTVDTIVETDYNEETLIEFLQGEEMKRVAQLMAEMQAADEEAEAIEDVAVNNTKH